ncbi:MAG: dephospho-CoA kinase [Dehalococcoidales bacterium]|nr:dephospho-CoA kinase [Dehalococcoidales bacterium]
MTKVIGLTGGIGSGKSTVARFLAEMGAIILDADKLGHEVFKPDTPAWHEVVATFGTEVLSPGGEIDRQKLGGIVFNDPEALSRLNRIMHPRINDMAKARIEEYRRQGADVVVLEAAILIEADWTSVVDEVWVTVAPEDRVLERVKEQRGLDETQIRARIRSQLTTEERIKHADVVIQNAGDLDEIKSRVREQWDRLHSGKINP